MAVCVALAIPAFANTAATDVNAPNKALITAKKVDKNTHKKESVKAPEKKIESTKNPWPLIREWMENNMNFEDH